MAKWLSVRLRTKWFWDRVQLQSLNCKEHIQIFNYNSAALPYINTMGPMHSIFCNDVTKHKLDFAHQRVLVSFSHILGVENTMLGKMSKFVSHKFQPEI